MTPKNSRAASKETEKKKEEESDQEELFATDDLVKDAWNEHVDPLNHNHEPKKSDIPGEVQMADGEESTSKGHKRKQSKPDTDSKKAQKKDTSKSDNSKASPVQVLKFLLSDDAVQICRAEEELKDIEERGKDLVTYADLLSPFEELLCAVVLSRPISHRLGLRTIRTVLNAPYSFNSPEAVTKAGSKKVHQALWDAKTQHKDKTADQIELIAEAVSSNDWSANLKELREKAKKDVEEERGILQSSIKGLGKTGLNIFYRRIQWQWEEAYPFIDDRTKSALEGLGLPSDAWELVEFIESNWDEVKTESEKKFDATEQQRRAFVLVLERAIGGDLEKKSDQILEGAAKL